MMEHTRHRLREDMRKHPDELAHEADEARAELEHTLEELERTLSPGEMLDRMLGVTRRGGAEFGSNLVAQVRSNPLPTLLTGAGLAWLMAASSRPPREGDGGDAHMSDRASAAASTARGAAHSAAEKARSSYSGARGAAGEAAEGAAESMRHAGTRVTQASRSGAESLRDSYEYLSREQPLVLGALAVAAGAAIGALMPSSEAESELMGETSDKVKHRLRAEGERRAEDAKAAAADAAEAAERRVERHASGGERPEAGHEHSASAEPRTDGERTDTGRADPLRPGPQA